MSAAPEKNPNTPKAARTPGFAYELSVNGAAIAYFLNMAAGVTFARHKHNDKHWSLRRVEKIPTGESYIE
jgi:hypothetical protein